jgi:thiol-disulfide isomerase/thioredoxin
MPLLISRDLIVLNKCCIHGNVPAPDDRGGFPARRGIISVIDIGHDRQGTLNPEDIIQIGPLALALDRLVAVGLILAFLTALDWIIRRYRAPAWQPAVLSILAGLLAARGGHVWLYRESYALEPVAALQVWLGGWDWRFGVAGAGIVLILTLRRLGPAAAGIAALGTLSLIWIGFLSLGVDKPALRLPQGLVLEGAPPETGSASEWRIDQLRGRPLVINLWATWCPPCRREMPMLTQAAKVERRATILLVNQGERPAQISAFLRALGLNPAHIALDPTGILGEMTGASALPTTLFIDRDGTVRQVHTGEITQVQLDIAIRALE